MDGSEEGGLTEVFFFLFFLEELDYYQPYPWERTLLSMRYVDNCTRILFSDAEVGEMGD